MPTYNAAITRSVMGGMIPVEYAREIFGKLTESSHVMRMARRLRDMTVNQRVMPVLSALPLAYFVTGDAGLKQTTKVEWEGINLYAEELAVIVPIPQAAFDDNQFPIWDEVEPYLIEALGLAFDNAVLWGTNAPAAWPTDIYAGVVAASHLVALGTGADLYDDIMDENGVIAKIEEDGFMATGFLAALNLRGRLRGLRASTGELIFQPSVQGSAQYSLDGQPCYFPLTGCVDTTKTLLVCGQWDKLVYALRQDLTWKLADEAIIQDGSGNIVYNLFQQDMIALRVVMRLGWQLPNPVNRINTNSTTRYPFSMLGPAAGSGSGS